ncbi:MAG: alpha/beta hydrolase [Sphingorhabdus sp.]
MESIEAPPEFLTRSDGVRIAYRTLGSGDSNSAATIVFLPGYMSDMQGGKAQALESWAHTNGHAMLRLDYSGCGESGGDFADGTLTVWRDDVLAAIDAAVKGPVLLVGSSMGGWLMLIVALALAEKYEAGRVTGMIGIAAAPDYTKWGFDDALKQKMAENGVAYQDNPHGPEPTPTYLKFWQDGEAQKLLDGEIPLDCPVRLLHGQRDADVPWDISMQLAAALRSDDVQICLVKDGDHRLSRPQDIDLLIACVAGLAG